MAKNLNDPQNLPEDLYGLSIVSKKNQYKSEKEEIVFLDREEEALLKRVTCDTDITISEDPLYESKYQNDSFNKNITDANDMYDEDQISTRGTHNYIDTNLMKRNRFK